MPKRKIDRRLLGTWKSDRRKTFKHFPPRPGAKPEAVRKLRAIFGKLVVRWTRSRCYSEFEGQLESRPYEVVASDSESVVVRCFVSWLKEDRLRQIHFEGDYYWLWAWGIREYFRRIAK
jgi:hypothetical protein